MIDPGGLYFVWNWNMFLYTCLVVTTIYTFIGWLSKDTNLVEKSSKPQDMSMFSRCECFLAGIPHHLCNPLHCTSLSIHILCFSFLLHYVWLE